MKFFALLRSRKRSGSRLFRYGWKVSLLVLLAAAGFAVFLFYGTWAQTFDMKNVGEMPGRNTVYDVDGKIYSRLAGANRLKVSLSEVSPFFISAVLAREDARFYQHKGIDWPGILRALIRDITSGSAKEGASSITQQLARNSLPLGGRTLSRKILEAMVALRIERQFTKQQILELYINRIYFGTGCYGVETASQAYFSNSASKLNLSEAAILAGLNRSPNRFSPLKNPQGAVVVIDNASGGIRALVGGRDYAQSKFNRAMAPTNRQVGSAFKPFVYTVAFSHGLLPGAAISDGPIQPGEIDGAGNWSPGNSDGTYVGIQPCSYGLIHSRNTMSVRVGQFAGLDAVQKVATTLNLGENIPRGPAIYIGSFETNLKDFTAAYSVFPNAGVRKQAYIIERIDDSEHHPIYRAAHISAPALDPSAAWMTSQLMEEVLTRGTAASARSLGFNLPAAGKTGTTNDYKDAWFMGYTNTLTCGVWVGFDQPVTIIPRGYGAALALPVWTQVMNRAAQLYPTQPLQPTMPIQHAMVCSISNHLATTGCQAAGTAYEIDLPADKVPTVPCEVHGGEQMQFADKLQGFPERAATFPNRFFRSFRRLFGGK